jgi:hypothetical protein
VRAKGGRLGAGGEMPPKMYTHMNKWINNFFKVPKSILKIFCLTRFLS